MFGQIYTLIPFSKFFGVLAALLALQIASFYLNKLLGRRVGVYLSAILSGAISSTAAVLFKAKESYSHPHERSFIPFALMATATSVFISLIIVLNIHLSIGLKLVIPMTGIIGVLFISSIIRWHKKELVKHPVPLILKINIQEIITQAVFLLLLYMTVAWVQKTYNGMGGQIVAFLAGLFELHGLSIATSELSLQGLIAEKEASDIIFTGVLASLFSKGVIGLSVARNRSGLMLLILMTISGAIGWSLYSMIMS